jgi:hypothetical protein
MDTVILVYAHYLKLDVDKEKDLLWIARQALTELPEGWEVLWNDAGEENDHVPYFHNLLTDFTAWVHPEESKYLKIVLEEKRKFKEERRKEKERRKSVKVVAAKSEIGGQYSVDIAKLIADTVTEAVAKESTRWELKVKGLEYELEIKKQELAGALSKTSQISHLEASRLELERLEIRVTANLEAIRMERTRLDKERLEFARMGEEILRKKRNNSP